MTTTDLLTDMLLVESEKTATIHAPVERVDITCPTQSTSVAHRRIISPPEQQRPTTAGRCRVGRLARNRELWRLFERG